jgi:hypothetical protein
LSIYYSAARQEKASGHALNGGQSHPSEYRFSATRYHPTGFTVAGTVIPQRTEFNPVPV